VAESNDTFDGSDDTLTMTARVVDWDEEPTVQCVYERDPETKRWRGRSRPPMNAE
jgi:hypothetical protein